MPLRLGIIKASDEFLYLKWIIIIDLMILSFSYFESYDMLSVI